MVESKEQDLDIAVDKLTWIFNPFLFAMLQMNIYDILSLTESKIVML